MPDSTALALPLPGRVPARPVLRQGLLGLPRFRLHDGGEFRQASVAWRLVGPAGAPVVAALGGISAHRTAWDPDAPAAGWWHNCIGPGQPLDTRRFAVLGIDWIGGTGGSTAPEPGESAFPSIDARDQAAALLAVCNHLRIATLHAVVGASYGGMVGLALAEGAPARVGSVLAISAAHRSNALATGWRSIQRAIVRQGIAHGDGRGALAIARALAMTTYRTRTELERRFPVDTPACAGSAGFMIERYLLGRGAAYAAGTRPESFLCLSESIDRFRVDPARIRVPVRLVAVVEDQLVTLADMRELAAGLAGPVALDELHSEYGHDAFLKETDLLAPAFRAALEGEAT